MANTAVRKASLETLRFRNFLFLMEYQMNYMCLLAAELFGMLCLVERRFEIECIQLSRACSVSCLFFGLNRTSAVTFVDTLSEMSATNSILS